MFWLIPVLPELHFEGRIARYKRDAPMVLKFQTDPLQGWLVSRAIISLVGITNAFSTIRCPKIVSLAF